MQFKLLEIRDKGTTIPSLAIELSKADGWLVERAGFGYQPCVYLVALAIQQARWDPYTWDSRTFRAAHLFITANYRDLLDGQVVDVEFILGEAKKPKSSERPA